HCVLAPFEKFQIHVLVRVGPCVAARLEFLAVTACSEGSTLSTPSANRKLSAMSDSSNFSRWRLGRSNAPLVSARSRAGCNATAQAQVTATTHDAYLALPVLS